MIVRRISHRGRHSKHGLRVKVFFLDHQFARNLECEEIIGGHHFARNFIISLYLSIIITVKIRQILKGYIKTRNRLRKLFLLKNALSVCKRVIQAAVTLCSLRARLLISDIINLRMVLYFDRNPACKRSLLPGRKSHLVNLNNKFSCSFKLRVQDCLNCIVWLSQYTAKVIGILINTQPAVLKNFYLVAGSQEFNVRDRTRT